LASSEYAKCELCNSRTWFTESEKYPRYCESCKKRDKITYDEILDVHELLDKMVRINISPERI
jgi:Cdc6-like AAA superfamily ATPase